MELENVTKPAERSYKRRHDDACGLAHALDLIGERWGMLVMRELAYGARRFSELKADLPGISANVLTQRLTQLGERGLIRKIKLPPPASVHVYEATEWGLEAMPVIASLGKWAARSPLHDPTLSMSHVAAMMSLKTLISPKKAGNIEGQFGFRFPKASYVATLAEGQLQVDRREPEGCNVIFTGTPTDLVAVVHGGEPLDLIQVEGDREMAERFVKIFELPQKVA
jgi:DNA-binding HxlR family transcriptional regulator